MKTNVSAETTSGNQYRGSKILISYEGKVEEEVLVEASIAKDGSTGTEMDVFLPKDVSDWINQEDEVFLSLSIDRLLKIVADSRASKGRDIDSQNELCDQYLQVCNAEKALSLMRKALVTEMQQRGIHDFDEHEQSERMMRETKYGENAIAVQSKTNGTHQQLVLQGAFSLDEESSTGLNDYVYIEASDEDPNEVLISVYMPDEYTAGEPVIVYNPRAMELIEARQGNPIRQRKTIEKELVRIRASIESLKDVESLLMVQLEVECSDEVPGAKVTKVESVEELIEKRRKRPN